MEKRGIPWAIADQAGVRFQQDFAGQPAVLVPLHDQSGGLTAVHGRYLQILHAHSKMLTIGTAGGMVIVPGGWQRDPLIVVEGLFDALSLATCGFSAAATMVKVSLHGDREHHDRILGRAAFEHTTTTIRRLTAAGV